MVSFQMVTETSMPFDDLTGSEKVFQWVVTDKKWKPDQRCYLVGLGDNEIIENRYEGSPEERIR